MLMSKTIISTKEVSLLAVFSALSVIVIKIFPRIPIVGVPEAGITFDAAIAPLYGMIIGPYLGFAAALIGGLVTAGSPFSILTSFAPAISAMTAGFLTYERVSERVRIPGWVISAALMGVLIVGWYLTPIGAQAPLYPLLHFSGFLAIIITRKWVAKSFNKIEFNKRIWQLKSEIVLIGIIFAASGFIFSKSFIGEEVWILPYLSVPFYIVAEILILYGIFGGGRFSYMYLGLALMICADILPKYFVEGEVWFLPYVSIPLYVTAQILILYGFFGERRGLLASSIFMSSYCGILADHMLGNLIFIGTIDIITPLEVIQEFFLEPLGLPSIPSLFMYMLPVSTTERILMTVIATVFGVSLLMALYRIGLIPRAHNNSTHNESTQEENQ
jgi:hypothetical protein